MVMSFKRDAPYEFVQIVSGNAKKYIHAKIQ